MTLVIQISNLARHGSAAVNNAASAPRRCSVAPNPRGARKSSRAQVTTRGDADHWIEARRPQEGAVAVGDHHDDDDVEDRGESEFVTKIRTSVPVLHASSAAVPARALRLALPSDRERRSP